MHAPRWVKEEVVYAIHQRQLAEHGGLQGVRDAALLSSALHRPLNLWAYGDPPPGLSQLASAYGYGIAKNHPFLDGNKRVAFVVCRLFLRLNGKDFKASQKEKYAAFIALAQGDSSEEDFALWIEERLVSHLPLSGG